MACDWPYGHVKNMASLRNVSCYTTVHVQWVSEQILNGTSAQLGYTVPFTLLHAGKYRTEDRLKTEITKTKDNQKKQTTQNTAKQNYPGSVTFYDTRPWNEAGLIVQCSRAHTGTCPCSNKCWRQSLFVCLVLMSSVTLTGMKFGFWHHIVCHQ